jgi:hypothetical protein
VIGHEQDFVHPQAQQLGRFRVIPFPDHIDLAM